MVKQKKSTLTTTKRLSLFVQKARQMQQRTCFDAISSYKSSYTLSWKQGSSIQLTNLKKPETEPFRSYLIDFRHFIANESPVQIGRILNLTINHARHIAFREQLISLQSDWKEIDKGLPNTYHDTPRGQELVHSGKDLFLLWLNGTIFHPDVEAEAYFESMGILKDTHEVDYAKYIGLYSNFIVHLAAVIDGGLNANWFDLGNEFTPHTHPRIVAEIGDEGKASVIEFWKGTKKHPQELSICEDHDQDSIVVVEGYEDGMSDFQNVKVEIRGCCRTAVDNAIIAIKKALAWIDYLKEHGSPSSEPIQILELEVINEADIQNLKAALDNYKYGWRKKVSRLRCPIHGMPPGARAFGVDMYHQGTLKINSSVYLQGCCVPFMEQVLKTLQ